MMAYKTSRTRKALPIPQGVKTGSKWGPSFSRDSGFAFVIHKKYWMSVFIHGDLTAAAQSRKKKILATEGVIAHCISCVGEDWEVRSEPTDSSRAGFIVYTAKGKPVGSGEIAVDDAGTLSFSSHALYPGITNAVKFDYKIEGKGKSDGSWEVGASVTVSDSRS
jgi:hypothetical protein